jgi:hypothetical protein
MSADFPTRARWPGFTPAAEDTAALQEVRQELTLAQYELDEVVRAGIRDGGRSVKRSRERRDAALRRAITTRVTVVVNNSTSLSLDDHEDRECLIARLLAAMEMS